MNAAQQRRNEIEQGNADLLEFGPLFEGGAVCLNNAEVAIYLQNEKTRRMETGQPVSEMFEQSLDYAKRFRRIKNETAMREVRNLLESAGLEQYECAAICNLYPTSVEEAKTIIPSLKERPISDEDLDEILQQMLTFRADDELGEVALGDGVGGGYEETEEGEMRDVLEEIA